MGLSPAQVWDMDPEQIDLMVAFTELERDTGPHGIPMREATDQRAAPGFYGDGAYGFKATLVPDWAQHAVNVARKRLKKENPDVDLDDYRAVVERVDYDTGGV